MTKDATELKNDVWLAGADGCKAGWIVAFVRPDKDEARIRVVSNFAEILASPEAPAVIAVDVPIGLPDGAGPGKRDAEYSVRPLLGKLKRSVFPIPSRGAVYAEIGPFSDQASRYAAHQRACLIAEATSNPRRRITIQAFGIFPKIREVDKILRDGQTLGSRVFETHPEMAFREMNGQQPLSDSKKGQIGLRLRKRLLVRAGLSNSLVEFAPPKGAALDDLIDALACAIVSRRIHAGIAKSFPTSRQTDAYGLPMAIWA